MFDIGQKVVCIDNTFDYITWQYVKPLTLHHIYTIRDIVPGTDINNQRTVAVYLEEIINSINEFNIERGYAPTRFAPLTPLEDIATQHEYIKHTKELVPA